MLFLYILIFIASCFLLIRSGTWLVRSLVRIAQALEWSEFWLTFCLLAFVTSLPELFVGLSSAFHQTPQLSFGNIIGANILNLTLGVGLTVLVAGGLKLKSEIARRDSLYTAIISFLPLLLMLDGGELSRIDGIILLGALAFYLQKIFHQKQRFTKVFNHKFQRDWTQFKLFLLDLAVFFGAVVLLLLAGEGVVRSITFLAGKANMPLIFAGILFVSLGTALPELIFGIRAVSLGHQEMILGNFMGTVVVNSTLILGLVALISPLKVLNLSLYFIGILFTSIVAFTFAVFSRTGRQITKKEAFVLIVIYLIFVSSQIFLGK